LEDASSNNLLWGNNFYNNAQYQANCTSDSFPNKWYYNQTGNYYGDYVSRYVPPATNNGTVWNIPYQINGTNEDLYPLVNVETFNLTQYLASLPSPSSPPPPAASPPAASVLAIISQSTNGNVTLSWASVAGATSYSVYRSTSPISSVSGLTAIAMGVTGTTYTDTLSANGTYYYVVVAVNSAGSSAISNCVSCTVAIPPSGSNSGAGNTPGGIAGYDVLTLTAAVTLGVLAVQKPLRKRLGR
jgi:hypothetical protein